MSHLRTNVTSYCVPNDMLNPVEEQGILPFGELEDDNMKAAYRFEHGLIW